jgi:hypothetical protein
MTAPTEYWLQDAGRARERAAKMLEIAMQAVLGTILARSRPAVSNFVDHAYTWASFGLFSAASFYHSTFSGLLVSGFLTLILSFAVSDLWRPRTLRLLMRSSLTGAGNVALSLALSVTLRFLAVTLPFR